MWRILLTLAGIVGGLAGLRYYLMASAPDVSPPASMAEVLPANPLLPCPATPNCVRTSRLYPTDADTLSARVEAALESVGGKIVEQYADKRRLRAAFQLFLFTDDVDVAVEPHAEGAVLHLRSASRVGHGDLGVNARRVQALLDDVENRL